MAQNKCREFKSPKASSCLGTKMASDVSLETTVKSEEVCGYEFDMSLNSEFSFVGSALNESVFCRELCEKESVASALLTFRMLILSRLLSEKK